MTARLRLSVLATVIAVVAIACASQEPPKPSFTGDLTKGNPTTTALDVTEAVTEAPTAAPLDPTRASQLKSDLAKTPDGCEFLVPGECLLPFPSDSFTVADPATATHVRVNLPQGQFPNTSGQTLDVTEWNRNDGWSPSTPILIQVPNLDFNATNFPTQGEMLKSTTTVSASVIVDLDTGQLVPHWAEMDSHATDPARQALILRPSTSLIETHRFAVALRNLVGTNGAPLSPTVGYQALRDNLTTAEPRVENLRTRYNQVFSQMATAGVSRKGLYTSWYFTVASPQSLAGRVLSMRDDAFGQLNGGAPKYAITDTSTTDLQPGIDKIISGTYEVPLYLTNGGAPGSRMAFDPANGQPQRTGTYTANFTCVVPKSAIDKGEAFPVVYGHGLLGSADEVTSSDVQTTAATINGVYSATDWIGLAEEDLPFAAKTLADLSNFPSVADRLQQGILNTLFLGDLITRKAGLAGDPALKMTKGGSSLNIQEAFFDGNSQGGIMGGAATAVSNTWSRAVLGVTGMNYSTLLQRSVDFNDYAAIMYAAYPDPLEQQQLLGLLQMLWDRGETSGYVQHLTDRAYDGTEAHSVVLTIAYGDHQVANVTADNIARTLKMPIYRPILEDSVKDDVDTGWNLREISGFPATGSAIFYWNAGTLTPPLGNITPTMGPQYQADCQGAAAKESVPCRDPHGDIRRQPSVMALKKDFFAKGDILDPCKLSPCVSKPRADFDY